MADCTPPPAPPPGSHMLTVVLRTPLDWALYYASIGIPVFPVNPSPVRPFKGKPLVKGWTTYATTDRDTIIRWWTKWPDALVGVPCGARSNSWVLDVDGAQGRASLAALEAKHGPLPLTFVTKTAGDGAHYRFAYELGRAVKSDARSLAPGLDTRGYREDGTPTGYVVMPGSVRTDGKRYEWADNGAELFFNDIKDLPPAPNWLVEAVNVSAPKAKQTLANVDKAVSEFMSRHNNQPTLDPTAVARMIDACRHLEDTAEGRNNALNTAAVKLGHLVPHHLTQAEVEDALLSACAVNGLEGEDGRDQCEKTIASGLTKGMSEPDFLSEGELEAVKLAPAFDAEGEPIVVEDLDRLFLLTSKPVTARWLVDGAIVHGPAFGFLPGSTGAGKTFILLALAKALALGQTFFKRETLKGGTYICASEGAYDMPDRALAAFYDELALNGLDPRKIPIMWQGEAPPDLRTDAGLKSFIVLLKRRAAQMLERTGIPLRLVVFDTLAMSFRLDDENAAAEVNAVCRACQVIGRALGVTVLVTHHFGKDKSKQMRGSSAFGANADFVITVEAGELRQAKSKASPQDITIGYFELVPVTVRTDDKQKPVTSLRVVEIEAPGIDVPQLPGGGTTQGAATTSKVRGGATALLIDLINTHCASPAGMPMEALLEIFASKYQPKAQKAAKRTNVNDKAAMKGAFKTALEAAVKGGRCSVRNGSVFAMANYPAVESESESEK